MANSPDDGKPLRTNDSMCMWQAIKVQTGLQQIETALMITAELGTSLSDLRVKAIHHRDPMHTFMFDSQGTLLTANDAVYGALKHKQAGR